jgi:protoporphyrinogen oxidase
MATIDIVGGGLTGLATARNLLQQGMQVRVWERAETLGGLMGQSRLDALGDITADRYDHAIHANDRSILQLINELGLSDSLRMRPTRRGFYHDGRTFPMSGPIEFLTFPPLSRIDRVRLAYTLVMARQVRDWHELEHTPVIDWLTRLSGPDTVEKIWRPLLQARFDGRLEHMPATYMWAQLMRSRTSYDLGTRDQMGYLEGGFAQLIEALADDIRHRGGEINCSSTVNEILVMQERAVGVLVDGRAHYSDGVVLTIQTPLARKLLPAQARTVAERWGRLNEYLGVVSLLLALRRPLSPYYTLTITDPQIPFTSVIETTNLIAPRYTGGYHLVYLPKYLLADSPYAAMDDAALQHRFLQHLFAMFPDLSDADIAIARVEREQYAEPLHPLGRTGDIPAITSDIAGLYLANSAQIYPQLRNGESVVQHTGRAADIISKTMLTQDAIQSITPRLAGVSAD